MFKQVKNKSRYKTAQDYYWYIRSRNKDYLFTDSALEEAEERANKNPEDIPKTKQEFGKNVIFSIGILAGAILCAVSYFAVKLIW